MDDLREKVIRGLDYCTKERLERCDYDCPYFDVDGCSDQVKLDALSLLKAQEPKTGDAISRSALLAAYDAAHKGPPGAARKMIEDAPALMHVEKWISVKERLPGMFEPFYAACKSLKDDRENWTIEGIYKGTTYGGPWGVPMVEWGDAEVYAWMPKDFPEPPKEETE